MQSLNLNWCSDLNDWVQLFVVIWNCYVILPLHTKNSFSRHVYRVIQRKASNCPIFSKPCMIDLYGFESYNLKECSLEIVQRGETQWAKGNKGCGNSSRNFTFFFLTRVDSHMAIPCRPIVQSFAANRTLLAFFGIAHACWSYFLHVVVQLKLL